MPKNDVLSETDDLVTCGNCGKDIVILSESDAFRMNFYDNKHILTNRMTYLCLSAAGVVLFGGLPAYAVADKLHVKAMRAFPKQVFLQGLLVGPITVSIGAFCAGFGYNFLPMLVTKSAKKYYDGKEQKDKR
eukprot:Nk52_evm20s293 gene=Nk52_evmTU20s293